jgi:hypothetical protein
MSYRKVYGGTPVGSESRCDTCANARIIQGYAESERVVICVAMDPSMPILFKVAECSVYEDKRLPSYWEMKQIAWTLRTKSAGSAAGFVLLSEVEKATQPQQQEEASEETPAAAAEEK